MLSNPRHVALITLLALTLLTLTACDAAGVERGATSQSAQATHIATFAADVEIDQLLDELEEHGVRAHFVYRHAIKGASLSIPTELVDLVAAHPGVVSLEPNSAVELLAFPEDQEVQHWSRRGGIDASHPFADINGDDVDTDVDIAIIDSGVQGTHPDINLHVAVDCIFGRGGENPPVPDGCVTVYDPNDADLTNDDPAASVDAFGHGTRVAGVAAARDNGFGIVGMAPGARVWSAQLSGDDPVFGGGAASDQAFTDAFIGAIDWVTANASEIEVANISLRLGASSAAARLAVQGAVNSGVVIFAAAGNNSGADIYGADGVLGSDDVEPAAYPEVAAISGYIDTDGLPGGLGPSAGTGRFDDTIWFGSNASASVDASNPVTSPGAAIDLAMPAVNIVSTCVVDAAGDSTSATADCASNSDGQGGNYGSRSGTSFAAPQAAGLAALLISLNGTRDINDDELLNQDDVYAVRQALINLATAQNDANFGLTQPSGDPDGNPEPLGSARMVLNLDLDNLTLPEIASSQTVTVTSPFVPRAATDRFQLNLLHDRTRFTIENPQCGVIYAGGTASAPVENSGGTGTLIECSITGDAAANSGSAITFDIVRTESGAGQVTLAGGESTEPTGFFDLDARVPSTALPDFSVFGASISGDLALQSVADPTALELIAPEVIAIPVSGSATVPISGDFDPTTGTFLINLNAPGDYDIEGSAEGFLSRRFSVSTVDVDGIVNNSPPPTTLRAGDVNGDGRVDTVDLSTWMSSFGEQPVNRVDTSGANVVDVDGNLAVNAGDMSLVISNQGLGPGGGGAEDWLAP